MTVTLDTRQPDADTKTLLQNYLDALAAGDLDAIADSFTEYASWYIHGTLPVAGVKRGREEIMEFLVGAVSLFRPGTQTFTFGDVTAEADRAVLEWRVQGLASATGKSYDNAYCGVFRFVDGRIAEVREYLDSLHAADILFADAPIRAAAL